VRRLLLGCCWAATRVRAVNANMHLLLLLQCNAGWCCLYSYSMHARSVTPYCTSTAQSNKAAIHSCLRQCLVSTLL
jgi:hypothetical protein